MKKLILIALLGIIGTSTSASLIRDLEPNNTDGKAQIITIRDEVHGTLIKEDIVDKFRFTSNYDGWLVFDFISNATNSERISFSHTTTGGYPISSGGGDITAQVQRTGVQVRNGREYIISIGNLLSYLGQTVRNPKKYEFKVSNQL